jgi:hypothetical protein
LHGGATELGGLLLWPYVREIRDDGREQGLKVEMCVSL